MTMDLLRGRGDDRGFSGSGVAGAGQRAAVRSPLAARRAVGYWMLKTLVLEDRGVVMASQKVRA